MNVKKLNAHELVDLFEKLIEEKTQSRNFRKAKLLEKVYNELVWRVYNTTI